MAVSWAGGRPGRRDELKGLRKTGAERAELFRLGLEKPPDALVGNFVAVAIQAEARVDVALIRHQILVAVEGAEELDLTDVADAVAVAVRLIRVEELNAVVARIQNAVFVRVEPDSAEHGRRARIGLQLVVLVRPGHGRGAVERHRKPELGPPLHLRTELGLVEPEVVGGIVRREVVVIAVENGRTLVFQVEEILEVLAHQDRVAGDRHGKAELVKRPDVAGGDEPAVLRPEVVLGILRRAVVAVHEHVGLAAALGELAVANRADHDRLGSVVNRDREPEQRSE